METPACSVFVSHRTRDLTTAQCLVATLEAALGLSDNEILFTGQVTTSMAPGEEVATRLRKELIGSKVVIGLVTRATYESVYQIIELGAAWVVDRLLVAVTSAADLRSLPLPLNLDQSVRLDDRAGIIRLVEEVGRLVGRSPRPPVSYEHQIARLLHQTRYVARLRRVGRRLVRVAAVFALALLVLSYLLNRQNILGQVYEVTQAGALVPVSNATIFVGNERTGVSTEKYGWFNFSVWSAFPARHRLKLKLENEDAHYPTDWRGPWPLQSALLNSPIEFRYDASKGVDERFHIARGASLFGSVVYAFGGDSMAPASARGSPASYARSEVEVGVLVDELNITGLPGKFFKPKRAYFKAFINGRQIPDRDVLAPSPATLGAAISFFPVQSDRRTWIPLGEGPKRYTNLLCRFPLDVVSLLAAGKQLTLARDVVIQMLSESGDILGQFTIVRGRAFTIGQSMRIADPSKSSTSITVRPVVHSTVSYNLDWKPANARLPPGGSQLFVVRMNRTPPLSLEATLEQTSAGASAVGLPRALRFAPSASASQLQVRVTKQRGTLQISSRLPAALGGTQDDVDIVVK